MLDPFAPLNVRDLHFEPDLAKASTLPSRWYFEPDALRFEHDRIFARTWQCVGHAGKLKQPGDHFTAEAGGNPVVVLLDQEGKLRAFHNVCRHRGGPIARGEGNAKLLRCAYHGWIYGLDGALKTTPEFNGVACFEKKDHGLAPVAVDRWGPFIFVNVSGEGPDLKTTLGAIPTETARFPLDRMGFFKRVVYELDCNWKVYVDNYLEGYHIPLIHPGLMKELDYAQYRTETQRFYSKQHAPIRNKNDSLYRRNLPHGAVAEALYYWVFPNLMLNIYPDNVQINIIVPLSAGRTATIFEWYLLDPDQPGAAADFAQSVAFSDVVQKEDIDICEAVQRGLRSRSYQAGRFSVEREGGVHHFHGLVCEFLQNETLAKQ